MKNAIPDHSPLPDGTDALKQPAPASGPRRQARLSHRQARVSLALLLDATTEPALAARLREHVDSCARCQDHLGQLHQAEAWLLAQPVEAPQMVARQDAAWAAIQARIAAEDAPVPVAEKVLSNGHHVAPCPRNDAEVDALVPLVAESADADASEADRLYRPLPVPQPPAPVTMVFSVFGKSGSLNPRRVVFVALAASLIVGSFAALFLAHFSPTGVPTDQASTPLFSMDVLDPGSETTMFSFDQASRHLLTLTGDLSYPCLASCPYTGPTCLHFLMMDVSTGKAQKAIRPSCTPGRNTLSSTTFVNLLDDSARGESLLVGNNRKVTLVDNRSGGVVGSYAQACCTNDYDILPGTLLDQHDQLLLTTAASAITGISDKLVAQDAITGQFKYQTALSGTGAVQAALMSSVTDWLYVWSRCTRESDASCVNVYQAGSGQKVAGWKSAFQQEPLAADPTENVLYVSQDQPNGQSETLVIDGKSGATVGRLPAAQAMAINGPLHHGYLIDDDGVTVVDTKTRRTLSTLPVLAHDENWLAPAVDVATDRVYLPIPRGKLLMAQDNAAGQLHLRSAPLAAELDAERAMTVNGAKGDSALFPWELPVGSGAFTVYHPFSRGTPSDCEMGWVAARSAAAITTQGGGQYKVTISLAWDDQFAQGSLDKTPTSQTSYPHQHTWLYDVPASGAAWLSSEQGAGVSTNCPQP